MGCGVPSIDPGTHNSATDPDAHIETHAATVAQSVADLNAPALKRDSDRDAYATA